MHMPKQYNTHRLSLFDIDIFVHNSTTFTRDTSKLQMITQSTQPRHLHRLRATSHSVAALFFVALFNISLFWKSEAWIQTCVAPLSQPRIYSPRMMNTVFSKSNPNENDDELDCVDGHAELVAEGDNDDEETDWIPDREHSRRKKSQMYQTATASPAPQQQQQVEEAAAPKQGSMYTEEEEELIAAMGGKFKDSPTSKREDGFLGDSTLQEIATDYSVPVCYLADVLCMWGVPIPINIHDRLGDLVTGEQAFAIVEAIYSLDVSALHDRYSNQSLMSVCDDYGIDLKDGFEMAMKEGWSLPFGVQTCLRVEQEEELIRVLGGI
jgi:biotin carboxyl carrier protein